MSSPALEIRSRRQTRAAVLDRLATSGGLFRPQLAAETALTEASISRIVAELREEGLVEEIRRPAPYPGGPTQIVALRKDQCIAGIELANNRVTLGVGSLAGEVLFMERLGLPSLDDAGAVARTFEAALSALAGWCRTRGVAPLRIAASIPGLGEPGGAPNPIVALDPARLAARIAGAFPNVPHVLANAVAAHAAAHLRGPGTPPVTARQLYVHLGHGVGGAWVEPVTAPLPIRPIEIGHVVLEPGGPACRCGHRGCLETMASAGAIAAMSGIAEAEMIAAGDAWPSLARRTARREAALREALRRVGLVIGNVLNVMPVSAVALSGWPVALPAALRDAVADGIDASIFGGLSAAPVTLHFLATALGAEPRAALAYALHDLVRSGGLAAATEPRRQAV